MRFVLATGGTGGHLFPAMRVADELKAQGCDVMFLGSFVRGKNHIEKRGFTFQEIGSKGFVGVSLAKKFRAVVLMFKAVGKAARSLRAYKPDAIIGFGGYGAFPVCIAGILMRYRVIIHEQNVIPGQANRLLALFARRIAVSFEGSRRYFNAQKTVFTGCPCHVPGIDPDRPAILEKFGLKQGKFTILVFGGSQGSRTINDTFITSAGILKENLDFQVIHICGNRHDQEYRDRYDQLGIPFALFEFLDKMEDAYCISDLVISRAGAVTVSEVANFRLPAVFIPYPFARGHQKENAKVLCDTGCAQLIEEKDLTPSKLAETVLTVKDHWNINESMDVVCPTDAARKLAKEAVCLGYLKS